MKKVQSSTHFEQLKNERGVVYLFTAAWCPDCTVIAPFLPELEERYDMLQFYEVNRDDFIDECQAHQIFGIPSFIAYHEGEEVERFVSKDRKTKEEIASYLDKVVTAITK